MISRPPLAAIAEASTHAPDSLRLVEIEAVSPTMSAVDKVQQFGPDSINLGSSCSGTSS